MRRDLLKLFSMRPGTSSAFSHLSSASKENACVSFRGVGLDSHCLWLQMREGLAGHKSIWVSLGILMQEGHHVDS